MKRWSLDARSQAPLDYPHGVGRDKRACADEEQRLRRF